MIGEKPMSIKADKDKDIYR